MSEKVTVKVERNILHLPAIALRGLVVFPNNLLHFEVGRDKSIAAVEWAVRNIQIARSILKAWTSGKKKNSVNFREPIR